MPTSVIFHDFATPVMKKGEKKKKKKNYINTAFSSTASTPVIKFTTHFIGLDKEQMVTVNTFFFLTRYIFTYFFRHKFFNENNVWNDF